MHPRAPAATARRGSNLPRVGDYNQVVVLEAIRRHPEGLSRVELTGLTGLSAQTVSNICRRLIDGGLVAEAGKQGVGPGKPRTLLRLAAEGRYAVGVHLDPAVVTVVVLDLLGHVVARSDHPLQLGAQAAGVLADIADDVAALVGASGIDRDRLVGLAQDRSGDVVVRLYEALGGRAHTRVVAGFGTSGVTEVDLLERPVAPPRALVGQDGAVQLRPFQIVTLRFARSAA